MANFYFGVLFSVFFSLIAANDTDNYILVFKHGTPRTDISDHIQLMYSKVDHHANTSSVVNTRFSTIGNFHWYTGQFPTASFETLFASSQHTSAMSSSNNDPTDILHYWVKDVNFSVQEMVQKSPPSWGLDRIDQRQGLDGLYKFSSKQGEGVTVYVLDTGVREDHEDLKGRVTIGKTIVSDDATDNDGHGTSVAGVCCGSTYGVAKSASVVSVKILDSEGNGRLSDLLKGLEWVVQQHNFSPSSTVPTSTSFVEQSSATTTMGGTTIIPVDGKVAQQNHPHNLASSSSYHQKGKSKTTTTSKTKVKAKSSCTSINHHQPSSHIKKLHESLVISSSSSSNTLLAHSTKINRKSSEFSTSTASPSSSFSPLPSSSLPPSSPPVSSTSSSSTSTQGKTKSIINLSLGALYNQVANDAVEQIIQLGIHVVVAAGNYGEDSCLFSPSSSPGAITVGAIDKDDSIAYYSNFGKCVDIFAPGTDITSITSDSTTATDTLTGTSLAAPHVAGSMALFLAQADYTPFELSNYMKSISTLVYMDFAINNTDGNANKSVLDNAVDTGVTTQQNNPSRQFNTPVNILYSQPEDGQPLWIFGGQLSNGGTTHLSLLFSPFPTSILLILFASVIPTLYFH